MRFRRAFLVIAFLSSVTGPVFAQGKEQTEPPPPLMDIQDFLQELEARRVKFQTVMAEDLQNCGEKSIKVIEGRKRYEAARSTINAWMQWMADRMPEPGIPSEDDLAKRVKKVNDEVERLEGFLSMTLCDGSKQRGGAIAQPILSKSVLEAGSLRGRKLASAWFTRSPESKKQLAGSFMQQAWAEAGSAPGDGDKTKSEAAKPKGR